ncbi:hypothetical protein M9H77_11095 [Catharanthus roseus]|uniref:Uncharacterized protein n=1 Tax=Catharanthus roseus TaxID=4058 RepID=A0ACC0BDM3_CATRO|nr:hypothetical protein M9H77_11095 [Catharanthus roseus]
MVGKAVISDDEVEIGVQWTEFVPAENEVGMERDEESEEGDRIDRDGDEDEDEEDGMILVRSLMGDFWATIYINGFMILFLAEGQDEYEKDGFIVDDVAEEEDRADSYEERRKKKKEEKKSTLGSLMRKNLMTWGGEVAPHSLFGDVEGEHLENIPEEEEQPE